jgi:SAM-dependent methyltransferase
MGEKTFRDLEHQGWLEKADAYREIFGRITEQAISPILATFGDLSGKRFLDVGSGTGELTAEAAGRGATAEGLDFAATMVAKASQKYPRIPFQEGNAEKLPYRMLVLTPQHVLLVSFIWPTPIARFRKQGAC